MRQRWSSARGQIISAGQDAFRNGLLDWSPRLQLTMYSCDIQATGEVLGKVYGVVSKRKGRIVSEEMKEGTAFFTVSALLPVVESFGFADGAYLCVFVLVAGAWHAHLGLLASQKFERAHPVLRALNLFSTVTRSSIKIRFGSRRQKRSLKTLARKLIVRILPKSTWMSCEDAR